VTESSANPWARALWEALVVAAALVLGIVIPLDLVLEPSSHPISPIWEGVVTLLFTLDVVLHPWSAGPRALPAGSRRRRVWQVLDVAAAVPFAPLFGVPALALLRLLKLLRVFGVVTALDRRVAVHPTVPRLAAFVFVLCIAGHWLACGWMLLDGPGRFGEDAGYLDALYWCVATLTTIGYGDVTPITRGQTIYAMGVMLLGVGLYGFVIGNLATLLTRVDMARAEHVATMERLSGFLRYRRIPSALQQEIYDYYQYLWENRMGYDESALIQGLPSALRRQLSIVLKADLVRKLSFLDGASQELVYDLCLRLKPVVFMPREVIVRAGEYGRHVYFVSRGEVEVEDPEGRVLRTLGEGDFFGEISLLTDAPRSATVRAVGYCDLYALDRETFRRTLAQYPDFAAHVEEVAAERGWTPD
jgi:voltage-gated potassium channel